MAPKSLFSSEDVEILERTVAYQGYFRIDSYRLRHARFDGSWTQPISREVFERGHSAGLLAYDPDRREFVLCEQFRIGAYAAGAQPWQLEIVAGIIEDGETPDAVARRETEEEIGQSVTDLRPIQFYFASPGGTSESVQLYLGRVNSEDAGGIFGLDENGEHIRATVVGEEDLRRKLQRGELANAMTVIAVQWFFLNRDQIRAEWKPKS